MKGTPRYRSRLDVDLEDDSFLRFDFGENDDDEEDFGSGDLDDSYFEDARSGRARSESFHEDVLSLGEAKATRPELLPTTGVVTRKIGELVLDLSYDEKNPCGLDVGRFVPVERVDVEARRNYERITQTEREDAAEMERREKLEATKVVRQGVYSSSYVEFINDYLRCDEGSKRKSKRASNDPLGAIRRTETTSDGGSAAAAGETNLRRNRPQSLKIVHGRTVKIALLGAKGSGKSSLLTRFDQDLFAPTPPGECNDGVTFVSRTLQLTDGVFVRCHVWDVRSSSSSERTVDAVERVYVKDASVVCVVVDASEVVERKTIEKRLAAVENDAASDTSLTMVCVVGTKVDAARPESLETLRSVSKTDQVPLLMTSAKNGDGVVKAFYELCYVSHFFRGADKRTVDKKKSVEDVPRVEDYSQLLVDAPKPIADDRPTEVGEPAGSRSPAEAVDVAGSSRRRSSRFKSMRKRFSLKCTKV